jgi:hypothetical protein
MIFFLQIEQITSIGKVPQWFNLILKWAYSLQKLFFIVKRIAFLKISSSKKGCSKNQKIAKNKKTN